MSKLCPSCRCQVGEVEAINAWWYHVGIWAAPHVAWPRLAKGFYYTYLKNDVRKTEQYFRCDQCKHYYVQCPSCWKLMPCGTTHPASQELVCPSCKESFALLEKH
jgi:hypothetical protein